jgi:hypothetical protein
MSMTRKPILRRFRFGPEPDGRAAGCAGAVKHAGKLTSFIIKKHDAF